VLDKSARSTLALLDKAVGQDWPEKCGLELVAADDGTVEWVHPETKAEFQRRGSGMLGGQVEEPGFAGAGQSSPTHSLAVPGSPGGAGGDSELGEWLENVARGFSQKYLAGFTAFGLDQLDMLRDLQEQDIADFFEDAEVLGSVQDGRFPRMHRRRLESAMRALAASAPN